MASSIASSLSPPPSSVNWRYDVFLSFRGEETREGFTGHAYKALKAAGFSTFIDNELARGENITTKLLEVIRRSKASVIVFSKSYVNSRWCLEELVEIMQCRKTVRQKVFLIFYDVDPSDVRKQTGPFADQFKRDEQRFASDLDMVKHWREALNEAANFSGLNLSNTADWGADTLKGLIEHLNKTLKAAGFTELNGDCLEHIAERLPHFKDFIAFSGVSHLCWSVCSNMDWDGPKPPCLMLSENPHCSSRSFFSLYNNRVFVSELEAARERRLWGSPHGWLLTADAELRAQLLNPISHACVNLPPFPTNHSQLTRGNRFHKVQKLFMFKTKIHPLKFLVIAILQPEDQLAFTTSPGDIGEWALVSNPKEFFFRSVAYFEHQIYALCDNGSVVRIDFNGSVAARAEFVASNPTREYIGYQSHQGRTGRAYLVSSQDGLIGVFRYSSKDIGFERTVQFFVYKFDFESLEWEPVWSIEDKALFVGNGNSWSISLAHTVNCNGNCIFYVDDMEGGSGLDNGIYDLETSQTEFLRFGADVPRFQPHATWITLKLSSKHF